MINADKEFLYQEISEKIIACAYRVYNNLGSGFLEKVYQNALLIELQKQGLEVEQQFPIDVYYEGKVIGQYYADLVVEQKIIVELKAVSDLAKTHEVQLVNYLKATKIKVGLLINFGDRITIKRKVLMQDKDERQCYK